MSAQESTTSGSPGKGPSSRNTPYARHGHLFIKKADFDKKAAYPDFGCTVESFTNADLLELETLGPLARIAPGGAAEHLERWSLFKNVPLDQATDEAIDRLVLPRVRM